MGFVALEMSEMKSRNYGCLWSCL